MSQLPAIPDNDTMLEMTSMLPTANSFGPLDEYDVNQEDMMEQMMLMQLIQQAKDSVTGEAPPVDTMPDTYDDMLMQLIDAVPLE